MFMRPFAADALRFERYEPKEKRNSVGGGVRKTRNTNGTIDCLNVFVLKNMRMSPATKTGKVIM
jgi:hypothetical protein